MSTEQHNIPDNAKVVNGKIVFTPRVSVVGTRTCPQCGITEHETMMKNDRYTFVSITVRKSDEYKRRTGKEQDSKVIGTKQMGCVYCYNKNRSRTGAAKELSLADIREKKAYYEGLEAMLLSATQPAKK